MMTTRRSHLAGDFDAQWNDDGHHVLHRLLTGERQGYYRGLCDMPATRLARCLKEGFVYQGEPSPHRGGKLRGTRQCRFASDRFCSFSAKSRSDRQSRVRRAAYACLPSRQRSKPPSRCSSCARKYRSFSWAKKMRATPRFFFSPITTKNWRSAVRDGRRREFASFPQFGDPEFLQKIPDPNARRNVRSL